MKLEDIVCDLEYAEKLKQLGCFKPSLFRFSKFEGVVLNDKCDREYYHDSDTYTVSELGEMLPSTIICDDGEESSTLKSSICGSSYALYYSYFSNPVFKLVRAKKEANARAELLIWLVENNHVNVEELNG